MSSIGTRIRTGRLALLFRKTSTEQRCPVAEKSRANTPYWLLWSTGIIAFVFSVLAFVLWGINGASTLFDMIIALCS
jgi:hypothetical protein